MLCPWSSVTGYRIDHIRFVHCYSACLVISLQHCAGAEALGKSTLPLTLSVLLCCFWAAGGLNSACRLSEWHGYSYTVNLLPWLGNLFSRWMRDEEENISSVGCSFWSPVCLLSHCSTVIPMCFGSTLCSSVSLVLPQQWWTSAYCCSRGCKHVFKLCDVTCSSYTVFEHVWLLCLQFLHILNTYNEVVVRLH